MPRRNLNRSFRSPVPDQISAERYLRALPGRQLYHEPCSFPNVTSPNLFSNDLPLELEVGCGTGEYLCSLAESRPDVNFIGVDMHLRSLHSAVETARRCGLPNILFIRANFSLMYPLLMDGSLDAIYLHFPDPDVDPKFRKRRLFSQRFLDEAWRTLTEGGHLSVMTDHQQCFFEMLNLAEHDGRWGWAHDQRYLTGFDPPVKSRYQRIWEGHGLPTLRFELMRTALVGRRADEHAPKRALVPEIV